MDTRRPQGRITDAIVVVNGLGTAVDCNNAFARLCNTPAGMLVGQELSGLAPALAASLEQAAGEASKSSDALIDIGNQTFMLDVQPFMAGEDANETGDRVVRLRGLNLDAVA